MEKTVGLERLGQSDLALAPGEPDIRGHAVVDDDKEKLGTVHGLIVDTQEAKVRFLLVRGGGVLGLGDAEYLVPVEAIQSLTGDEVHLAHKGAKIRGGPRYDPELVSDTTYWDDAYGWYGYPALGFGWPPGRLGLI